LDQRRGQTTLADIVIAGTWVPIERGLALAKQYNVEDLLRPIIDYVPTAVSPPPAPKHIVAPPTKAKKEKEVGPGKAGPSSSSTPSKTGPMSAAALQAQAQLAAQRAALNNRNQERQNQVRDSTPDQDSMAQMSGDESMTFTPEEEDSSSDTPSPIASLLGEADLNMGVNHPGMMDVDGMMVSDIPGMSRKRTVTMMEDDHDHYAQLNRARGQSAVHTPRASPRHLMGMDEMTHEQYTDLILNYFISETSQIPNILISPPHNYDPNSRIDEDGHTALHWACAMGRVRVVKLLLTAGASIFAGNNTEQTPLMRSVMFSNNYDVRKFPELYELLHRSTLNIDKHNRTVFHHISNLALTKGKAHAARYYMETILSRLADYPQELADVINFQDEDGETALTLAARARSRRLVKALLDHGADPKIKNRDFKSAEDYILEDERFRSSPGQGAVASYVNGGKAGLLVNANGSTNGSVFAPQLFNSEAARLAGGQCISDISAHMSSLAKSFDAELQGKERDILQAKALLTNIHAEVTEATRTITALSLRSEPIEGKRRELDTLQAELRTKVNENLRLGYEVWFLGQEGREKRWRDGGDAGSNGEDYGDLKELLDLPEGAEVVQAEEEKLRWEIEEKRKRRTDLVQKYVKAQAEVSS